MNQTQCIAAEAAVLDNFCNIDRVLHIIFGTIILIMLIKLACSYKTKSLNLHANFIILITNIFILYAIFVLSHIGSAILNFTILFTYSDPCDCLIQVWVAYLILIPSYIYNAGSPLFHFAIVIERILATIFVKIYEKQGKHFAAIITVIMWTLTFLFGFYVYLSSSMDIETFSRPMAYLSLTSIYNYQVLTYLPLVIIFLVLCIAIADYRLMRCNQKIKSVL